ncbi:respiration control sensor protein ArcB [Seminavis robusta]|uniref:histidine kinase n=1 Tax=Seminavis robusta TaxID=568900 RepID=A0A9N8DUF9_9STRA|nr:respiration control sensor protein ArcB [Seminavis robusta]|eukprot:Sro351_g124000.1 respiration control sensor protein ArcB (940) ;mRNA; r:48502-51818
MMDQQEVKFNPMASETSFAIELEEGLRRFKEREGGTSKKRKKSRNTQQQQQQQPSSPPEQQLTSAGSLSSLRFDDDDDHRSTGSFNSSNSVVNTKWLLTALIAALGAAASVAFMAFGVHATNSDMEARFTSSAEGITYRILSAWSTYETFGLWIHESCHDHVERNYDIAPEDDIAGHLGYCSRRDFRKLYEHITAQGVGNILASQYLPIIPHDVRENFEAEAREYYVKYYPHFNYTGITEQVFLPEGGSTFSPRAKADHYMPLHYVEPVEGNEAIIELDKLTATASSINVIIALDTWKPVLSPRLKLLQDTSDAYGVILAHPGVPTSVENVTRMNSVAQIVVRVPSFLAYALQSAAEDKTVYLYDTTASSSTGESSEFLGALAVDVPDDDDGKSSSSSQPTFTELPEVSFTDIPQPGRYFERELDVAGRKWTMVVVSTDHQADLLFVILGGTIIFLASLFCAAWFHSHLSRVTKLNRIKSRAQAEKAEIARIQAMKERQLNEFIAHEVRNPLSAAMSALSFVSVGVAENVPNPKHKQSILEDVGVMDASLQFINELLRNMLDIHRARSRQIKLNLSPIDIRRDILDPVAAILFMRGAKVEIRIECPPDLAANGDRMRLKQIVLNLSANAVKFVDKGYICLKAAIVNNSVELYVEDSGPGIPMQKRDRLFAKFQESLDSLNQGTGIGLAVCKNLSELMGADICLDEEFQSGVDGCPGTRFVLRLNQPPLEMEKSLQEHQPEQSSNEAEALPEGQQPASTVMAGEAAAAAMINGSTGPSFELPDTLSILVVDDDTMIRKMFRRAALRVAPQWEVEEAANGETALVITETRQFDVIFLDQYMASVEKQLLGTETARALRSRGVQSIICGLSANDMGEQFLESGADTFMMKPFPCKKEALTRALHEVLNAGRVGIRSVEEEEEKVETTVESSTSTGVSATTGS